MKNGGPKNDLDLRRLHATVNGKPNGYYSYHRASPSGLRQILARVLANALRDLNRAKHGLKYGQRIADG